MASPLRDVERIRALAAECTSATQIVLRLGLKPGGGNITSLKRIAEANGIDLPRYGRSPDAKSLGKSLDECLVIESTYNPVHLKARLIRGGFLEERCSECGGGPVWQGKPLVLWLEHKNGIGDDNRLENLCLLCPNCHTQTPTFAGRNVKRRQSLRDGQIGKVAGL